MHDEIDESDFRESDEYVIASFLDLNPDYEFLEYVEFLETIERHDVIASLRKPSLSEYDGDECFTWR